MLALMEGRREPKKVNSGQPGKPHSDSSRVRANIILTVFMGTQHAKGSSSAFPSTHFNGLQMQTNRFVTQTHTHNSFIHSEKKNTKLCHLVGFLWYKIFLYKIRNPLMMSNCIIILISPPKQTECEKRENK